MNNKSKPKIALILDTYDWAYGNIANQIIKNLSYKYDFKLVSVVDDLDNNVARILFLTNDCDLVHFFWRGFICWLYDDYARGYFAELGCKNSKDYISNWIKNTKISTGVYDHLFLEKEEFWRIEQIFKTARHVTVSSKILFDIYNNIPNIHNKPTMVVTDGVDLDRFYPNNIDRFDNLKNRKVKIGWVGNSKFQGIEDYKGVSTLIVPAVNELIKEGYPLEMDFADANVRKRPRDEMNDYYSKIDLYICASLKEGTPNPVLEAMACGIPIISTDVGIVREALGKLQSEYILEERTIECLKNKIKLLLNDMVVFKRLSDENLKQIKEWSWKRKCEDFDKFFSICLKEK